MSKRPKKAIHISPNQWITCYITGVELRAKEYSRCIMTPDVIARWNELRDDGTYNGYIVNDEACLVREDYPNSVYNKNNT